MAKRRASDTAQATNHPTTPSHAPPSKRRKTLPANTALATSPATQQPKTPSTAQKSETEKLTKYFEQCDKNGKPYFIVQYGHAAKGTGKSKKKALGVPYELKLNGTKYLEDAYVAVQPPARWKQMKHYNRFTVGDQTIANGEVVLVHPEEDSETDGKGETNGEIKKTPLDVPRQWKAQVHETRALNENRVFILVSWLNRPSDLPGGGASYHAKNELIPSNDFNVIDAMTVNGRLEVVHWDDNDDNVAPPEDDQYFWRQIFDRDTQTLSKLRTVCVDEQPHNPDKMIVQCSNPQCGLWLHDQCIADEAATQAAAAKTKKQSGRSSTDNTAVTSAIVVGGGAEAEKPAFEGATAVGKADGVEAYVFIKRTKSVTQKEDQTKDEVLEAAPVKKNEIIIIDKRGKKESRRLEQLKCLKCGTVIEDAD